MKYFLNQDSPVLVILFPVPASVSVHVCFPALNTPYLDIFSNDFVCLTIFTAGFEEIKCPIFSEILLNPEAVNDEMHIGAKPFIKSDLICNKNL